MIDLLSLSILAIAVIPALKLCTGSFLWTYHRNEAYLVILAISVYWIFIAALWHFYPRLLPFMATAAAIPTVFFWWRARPAYGVKTGLPTGSLSMVGSMRAMCEGDFYLRQGNLHDQVFKMSQFHRPVFCVTSIEKGLDLIRRNETRLRPPSLRFDRFIPLRFLRYMEQEDHRRYRHIFKEAFRPEITNANKSIFHQASKQQLERMCETSRHGKGHHPLPFVTDLSYDVFPVIFFGLTPSSNELKQMKSHFRRLDEFSLQYRFPDQIEGILCKMEEIILASAGRFLRAGNEQPRSSFLEELLHNNPGAMNDVTLRRNLIYIMSITRNDVTCLLVWVLRFLSLNTAWQEKIRSEPEPVGLVHWRFPKLAVDRFVVETLRMEQSEYLYREVLDEVEWNGFRIPRGWLVRVCTHEGHRNAEVFAHPERFDPDRFLTRKFQLTEYAPFGMGNHSCLGAHMALSIARHFVYLLASSYHLELINPGKRTIGGRHWMHWRPDDSFSVSLLRR